MPGHPRHVDTVFEVSGLQLMGVNSVKTETDEWIIDTCKKCHKAWPCQKHADSEVEKRLTLRLVFADSHSQCTLVSHHDQLLAAGTAIDFGWPDPLQDSPKFRTALVSAFRAAQWVVRMTFRENDYQQVLELECRHLRPLLHPSCRSSVLPLEVLPHCVLGAGCPVASLEGLETEKTLGLLSIGGVDAVNARGLIRFNEVQLPDEECLQQDPQSRSAMRVKRSVDCLLSSDPDGPNPFRAKLRIAGPASSVNWMLQGRPGEVHQIVFTFTETDHEWLVLWNVPVHADILEPLLKYWRFLLSNQQAGKPVTYESAWTPMKRMKALQEDMPTVIRENSAWGGMAASSQSQT